MDELLYLSIAFIVMWLTLYIHFTRLIKKYVKENFSALLEYFLQKEPIELTIDSKTLAEWGDSTVGYINQTRKKATDSQMELEKSANRLRGLI
ncbi:hypothetical protein [Streptococcus agalactiae]|uniref:hypothetical protein n=1 Tax=Streptococcus agalactiae TaxID=1311 RepID=UPI001CCEDDA7|nr:hypothetical protein [Streptococcus agalactiae]